MKPYLKTSCALAALAGVMAAVWSCMARSRRNHR